MAYDLNILCLMQEKKTKQLPFPSVFTWKVWHRSKNSNPKCYDDGNWHFMNSCSGFWYYLLPKGEIVRSSYVSCAEICNIDYEDESSIAPTNHCLPDELVGYVSKLDVTIEIKRRYRRDFEKIVDYFLSESPVSMIIFLPRWQGESRDIVHGVITKKQFFSMMKNKKIRLNMCYIIRK